jgi:hypothetical protein
VKLVKEFGARVVALGSSVYSFGLVFAEARHRKATIDC